MRYSKEYLSILTILACFLKLLDCHPQCLDFRAPFRPGKKLRFCSEYSDLGCCGSKDNGKIKQEYNYIRSRAATDEWKRCQDFVKAILCQKCSPYAAHIYDAEGTSKAREFPGLCTEYCYDFHDNCKNLIRLLNPDLAATENVTDKHKFCQQVAITDTLYCYPDVLTSPLLLRNLTRANESDATPGCLCLETIKDNLANPLWARHAGDGSGRLFVAEQKGRVRIYNTKTKKWRKGCFLNFSNKSDVSGNSGDERGFLGVAFHPKYSTNGRFFVFYSTNMKPEDVPPPKMKNSGFPYTSKVVISELKVSSSDPNKADPNYERVLLEIFHPYDNHNGGELMFGLDGYLYAFIGDGGGGGDPLKAGQDKSQLLGKVIRLDVDSDPTKPYTIPPDNPFVGEHGSRPEIYAYGIRNIWRCGLDRGGEPKGRIMCGDVGQSAYEEIDIITKGANYGWNSREGFHCYDNSLCGRVGPEELPIHAYSHKIGQSVTGGVFYRGCENPALVGQYIFGDYVTGRLFSLTESNGNWTHKNVNLCGLSLCQGGFVGNLNEYILSFGEDEAGEIYILTSKSSSSTMCDGSLYKFVDPLRRNDPSSCSTDLSQDKRVPLSNRDKLEVTETAQSGLPVATIAIKISRRQANINSSTNLNSSQTTRLTVNPAPDHTIRHFQQKSSDNKNGTDQLLQFPFTLANSRSIYSGKSRDLPSTIRVSEDRKSSQQRSLDGKYSYAQRTTTQVPNARRKRGKNKSKRQSDRGKCGVC